MADTTATVVGNLGHGTKTVGVVHTAGRPTPLIDHVVGLFEVPQGYASVQIAKLGAALTASTSSESASAATPQALSSVTATTLTPASYVAAIQPTTEAYNRADPALVNLAELCADEITYPLRRVLAYDDGIGIVKLRFTGLSNRVGTSGAVFTPSSLLLAYEQLTSQLGANVDAVAWISTKQWSELIRYGLTTASSAWGSPEVDKLFLGFLSANGVPVSGYRMSWGNIHICVDPDPNGFGTDSGDTVAAMFVPALAGLNGIPLPASIARNHAELASMASGGKPIAPAFAVGYREDPAYAARRHALPSGMGARVLTEAGIPIEILPRLYAGQNLGGMDGWIQIATAEVNDNSGVGMISVA